MPETDQMFKGKPGQHKQYFVLDKLAHFELAPVLLGGSTAPQDTYSITMHLRLECAPQNPMPLFTVVADEEEEEDKSKVPSVFIEKVEGEFATRILNS